MSKDIFERLNKRQPGDSPPKPERTIPRGPLLQPIVPPTNYKSPLADKCLDWLVNRWPCPTVRMRDFMRSGPPAARNRKSAIAMAEILVEHGWLVPLPTRQHNEKMWAIVRGPNEPQRTGGP